MRYVISLLILFVVFISSCSRISEPASEEIVFLARARTLYAAIAKYSEDNEGRTPKSLEAIPWRNYMGDKKLESDVDTFVANNYSGIYYPGEMEFLASKRIPLFWKVFGEKDGTRSCSIVFMNGEVEKVEQE